MKSRLLLLPAIGAVLIGLAACASPSSPPETVAPLPDSTAQESAPPEEPAAPAAPSLAIGELESGQIPVSIGDYTVVGPDQAASWGFACKGDREWTMTSGVAQYGIYYANTQGVESLRPSVEALASPEYPCRSALTDNNPHPGVITLRLEKYDGDPYEVKCNSIKPDSTKVSCFVLFNSGWRVSAGTQIISNAEAEREYLSAWLQAFADSSPLVQRLAG